MAVDDRGLAGSRTVERALRLLDLMAEAQAPLRLSDIARSSGYDISTASRLLQSLERYGYVRRERSDGRFRLGFKLLSLAQVARQQSGLAQLAEPVLEALVAATNETATLNVFRDDRSVVIAQVDSSNPLRMAVPVGTHALPHTSAHGKVLLAHQPSDTLDRILAIPLPHYTPRTITDPDARRANLARIREEGYAVDYGEREAGVIGVAAPVRDAAERVVASCGILGPEQRLGPERLPAVIVQVRAAAEQLSRELGWCGESPGPRA